MSLAGGGREGGDPIALMGRAPSKGHLTFALSQSSGEASRWGLGMGEGSRGS